MNNLVFFPGASGNTQFWNPLIAQLPKSYTKQVIAYPGFHGVVAHPYINSFDDLTDYQKQNLMVIVYEYASTRTSLYMR